MIPRTLETEVMDTAEEAAEYDAMDHREVNRLFVDDLLRFACAEPPAAGSGALRVLDVGTGTAQIPIELCRRDVPVQVTADDLAISMLQIARKNVMRAGLTSRIRLNLADAKGMSHDDASFDWVISNSIVHHIPDPRSCLAEMLRVLRPGGVLFVRDLMRPASAERVEELVAAYAGSATVRQQELFRASLHAALTLPEIQELLEALGLPGTWAAATSDRHWTIAGRRPL